MEGSTAQLNFNFTRLSQALAGVLCLGYVVQLVVPTARDYLTLVPGRCVGSKRDQTGAWSHLRQGALVVAGLFLVCGMCLQPAWWKLTFSG